MTFVGLEMAVLSRRRGTRAYKRLPFLGAGLRRSPHHNPRHMQLPIPSLTLLTCFP